jgi:hypothetical protein
VKDVMSAEQRSSALYRSAYQCAENKSKGLCNGYCGNCPLNVSLYVDDPREAVLIKTSAALDQQKVKDHEHTQSVKGWVWLFYIVVTIGLIYSCVNSCGAPNDVPPNSAWNSGLPLPPWGLDPNDSPEMIVQAVWEMGFYDVNNDNKISCVDYNVLLFTLWPAGKRRLIWNLNPYTGMNHLFTQLYIQGRWQYVDASGGPTRWDMREIWGSQYDPKYNKDRTAKWGPYSPTWEGQ